MDPRTYALQGNPHAEGYEVNVSGTKAPQLRLHVECLEKRAHHLNETASRLSERLGPVLRPEPMKGEALMRGDGKGESCPLANDLRRIEEMLADADRTLTGILETVEL